MSSGHIYANDAANGGDIDNPAEVPGSVSFYDVQITGLNMNTKAIGKTLFLVSFLFLGQSFIPSAAFAQTSQQSKAIHELIRLLGSNSYDERERAKLLLSERDDAATALRETIKSTDPEMARRAKSTLELLEKRQRLANLARLRKYFQNGEFDIALDFAVSHDSWNEELDPWKAVAEGAQAVRDREAQQCGTGTIELKKDTVHSNLQDFWKEMSPYITTFPRLVPTEIRRRGAACYFAKSQNLTVDHGVSVAGVFLSRKNVCAQDIRDSIVLAGGSVEIARLSNSLVVADGDIVISGSVSHCLLIARGDVHCKSGAYQSHCICSGRAVLPPSLLPSPLRMESAQDRPLGFIKFFDLTRAGLEGEVLGGQFVIKEVFKNSPALRAGLLRGDIIQQANTKPIESVAALRRLLRQHLAADKPLPLTLRRGEALRELSMRLD